MPKKFITGIFIIGVVFSLNIGYAWQWLDNTTSIFNTDMGKVINTTVNGTDMTGPLNDGAFWIVNGEGGNGQLSGLVGTDQKITEYTNALSKILKTIQNVVNYALGISGVVALIYLIIHGFIILTAAGDDSKVKKGFKGIKNAFLAIAGIGLSRIIISFIIWLINTLAA